MVIVDSDGWRRKNIHHPHKRLTLNDFLVGSVLLHVPLVTLILVTVNIAVHVLGGGMAACYDYGLIPAEFVRSGDLAPLATSLFLHDPDHVGHILGNMAFLAVFGALVEGALGGPLFLALYMAAGAAGGLLHVAVAPGAAIPLVGASGAVFGVLAVAAVLRPGLLGFVLAFGGFEVYRALEGGAGGVSVGAHLGGLVAGGLVAGALRAAGSEAMEPA